MDLICPSCQKRLTIEDRFAGMVVKCPLCSGMLQAPVLPNAPVPPPAPALVEPLPVPLAISQPPVPAPAPATMPEIPALPPTSTTPPPPAPSPTPSPMLDGAEVMPSPAEAPVTRLGEYARSWRWHVRPDILEWIAPGCVVAIFLLSLFTWYVHENYALNLWELAFTARGHSIYTFYTVVFMFLAMPVVAVSLIFEKCWLPLPEPLRRFWPFRSLIVGGLLALPFVFFLCDYIQFQFLPFGMQASIAMKLAFRIHLIAVVACVLQYWLETRRAKNAPLPRITIRW